LASPRFQLELQEAYVTALTVPGLEVGAAGRDYLEASIVAERIVKTEPCCESSIPLGAVDPVAPSSFKLTLDGRVQDVLKTDPWSITMKPVQSTNAQGVQLASGPNDIGHLTVLVADGKAKSFDAWLGGQAVEKSMVLQLSNGASTPKVRNVSLSGTGIFGSDWAAGATSRAYSLYVEHATFFPG
jgi:hypothetical protein